MAKAGAFNYVLFYSSKKKHMVYNQNNLAKALMKVLNSHWIEWHLKDCMLIQRKIIKIVLKNCLEYSIFNSIFDSLI